MANEVERLTYSASEAAQALGISKGNLYERLRRREICHVRVGRRVLIPRRSIERLLEQGGTM